MASLFKLSPFTRAVLFCCVPSLAHAAPAAPELDLTIQHYSKALTAEGVTRETRYEEKMMRRQSHVWVARMLPAAQEPDEHEHGADQGGKAGGKAGGKKGAEKAVPRKHKHFNYVVVPRHVVNENNKVRLEFIDAKEKMVVAIPPAEYDNVAFDGSWTNAFYLVDPEQVKAMPVTARASDVPGARWRERENNGSFQRVLWDEQKQIPLTVEIGDKAGLFYRRIDVKPQAGLSKETPWLNVKGFSQKAYSDFLD